RTERQPRVIPTASTIVSASTVSTAEARKDARMRNIQLMLEGAPYQRVWRSFTSLPANSCVYRTSNPPQCLKNFTHIHKCPRPPLDTHTALPFDMTRTSIPLAWGFNEDSKTALWRRR